MNDLVDRVTTTQNYFPVEDVTHRPKRMQKDMLAGANASVDPAGKTLEIPKMVTLERSISFYESHAEGDLKALYTQTAVWLRELLDRSKPVQSDENTDERE